MAQRYLLDPMGRQRSEEKGSQIQTMPRQRSPAPGRVFRSRTSASLTQAQIRSRRQSQHRGGAQRPVVQGSSGDVTVAPVTVTDTAGYMKTDRSEQTFKRTGTGPVGRLAQRHSNHSLVQPVRVKTLRLLRNGKHPLSQTPPSSSILPSSLHPSTRPPSPSSSALQSEDQQTRQDTTRTAFIKELSSRHQTSVPFSTTRESKLI